MLSRISGAAPVVSSRADGDLDGSDDGRLDVGRQRLVLEVELERFTQVGQRLLDGLTLAGDLDLQAAGDVPVALVGDRCGELQVGHRRLLSRIVGPLFKVRATSRKVAAG